MGDGEWILVVDDEMAIRTVIADGLQAQGYQVQMAADAMEALRACEQTEPDLALVDLKMPGSLDGLGLLAEIHRHWPQMVVILLTGYGSLDSAIAALRQGAHDYLTKPVSIAEIIESVKSGLAKRRDEVRHQQLIAHLVETVRELKHDGEPTRAAPTLPSPALVIDRQKHLVLRGNEPLELTGTEFDLLDYLAQHSDRVVTAQEVVKAIQGYDLAEADARPIMRVHIQRLRQKLGDDPEHPRYILSVRGKGYRFVG
jgi:two-component system KDP operon response regulator KdpE